MSSLVYLLREPVSMLLPALYTAVDDYWRAVSIEGGVLHLSESSGKSGALHKTEMNQSANSVQSYKDLLNLILEAQKVITL